MVTGTKLSQIASGSSLNPSTDRLVSVRSGTTDVLVDPSQVVNLVTYLADGLGTTQDLTKGILLTNTTAAVNNAPQISPAIRFHGSAWRPSSGTSQSVDMYIDMLTAQGNPPLGAITFHASINGGAYTSVATMQSNGFITTQGGVSAQGTISTSSNISATGNISSNSQGQFNTLIAGPSLFTSTVDFRGNLGNFANNNFLYDSTLAALSVGRGDTVHNGAVEGMGRFTQTIADPSFSVGLSQISDVQPVTFAVASQSAPALQRPVFSSITQIDQGGSAFNANGSNYNFEFWSKDGSGRYSVCSSVQFESDNNDGLDYYWAFTWTAVANALDYLIGVTQNGSFLGYILTGGVTSFNLDTLSFPDGPPTPTTSDYVANGTFRNYYANSYEFDPLGNPYQNQSAGAYNYNFTDDASGDAYTVLHNISTFASNVTLQGAPDGSSNVDHIDFSGTSLNESSDTWISGTVSYPNYQGVGFLANGSTLNTEYTMFNEVLGPSGPAYSGGVPSDTIDPADSNYYVVLFSISGQTTPYKVLRNGNLTGAKINAVADVAYEAWGDDPTYQPSGYHLAGLYGNAGAVDAAGLGLRSHAGQTGNMAVYQDSDANILGGLGPKYEVILPRLDPDVTRPEHGLYINNSVAHLAVVIGGNNWLIPLQDDLNNWSGTNNFNSQVFINSHITLADGTNGVPTLTWVNDSTMGIYRPGAHIMAVSLCTFKLAPCTTSYASLNVAAGTAPTSPNDGDVWYASNAFKFRQNGATVGLGAGTVTSVALSLPGIITVSGSPVTGSGTLTGTLATQTANTVWSGPTTGAAAAPTFRALVAADIPSLDASKITSGTLAVAQGGTGQATPVVVSNSFSATGTATTAFTVTIGTTQANNTYKVNITPSSLLATTSYYISAKTTTTFTITYVSALTGAVSFDWALFT